MRTLGGLLSKLYSPLTYTRFWELNLPPNGRIPVGTKSRFPESFLSLNWFGWERTSYSVSIKPIYGPNEAGAARVTIKHWWNFPMELCWFNWLKYLSDYKHINLIYISEYTKRNIYLVLRQRDKVFSLKPYYSAWALSKLILYPKTLNIACTLHSWIENRTDVWEVKVNEGYTTHTNIECKIEK